jgi:hypothetical protein
MTRRQHSFGTSGSISTLDKIGRYLSRRKVLKAIGDVDGKVILDLGCGFDAGISYQLLGKAAELIAIDLEVDHNLALKSQKLKIVEGYIPDVLEKIPENSIDILIANNIFEHLDCPEEVLRILHTKTRNQFTFYYNVPSWLGRYALEFAAFELEKAPRDEMIDHKRYYARKDLWQLLVDSGMRPDEFKVRSHKFGLNSYAFRRQVKRESL